jgi:hypothetical protein
MNIYRLLTGPGHPGPIGNINFQVEGVRSTELHTQVENL